MTNHMILKKGKTKIDHIYHISDIHISDKEEVYTNYVYVFNELGKQLKELPKGIICITGDVIDSKEIKSQTLELVELLFKILSENTIGVFVIEGNHDMNMNNNTETSILRTIINQTIIKNIYLLDEGIYSYYNIDLYHTIVHKSKIIEYNNISKNQKTIHLYHGYVSNKMIEDREHPLTSDFDKFDYVLLGDLHKMNFVTDKIIYSGTLVQQKYNEGYEHGFIHIDLLKNETIKRIIKPKHQYIKIVFEKEKLIEIPDNLTVELTIKCHLIETPKIIAEKYISNYFKKYKIINIEYKTILNRTEEVECDTFEEFINTEPKNKQLLEYYNKQYNRLIKTINTESIWSICYLEYDNLLTYGDNNHINFKSISNTVYIRGKNQMGKSSIIFIMLFAIYDTDGIHNMIELVNDSKDETKFSSKVILQKEDNYYRIDRYGKKKNNNITMNVSLITYRLDENNVKYDEKNITEDTRTKTNLKIQQLFGIPDILYNTSILLQHNNIPFIDLTTMQTKKFYEQIFNMSTYIDMYNEIIKKSNTIQKNIDKINTQKDIYIGLEKKMDMLIKEKEILKRLPQTTNVICRLNEISNDIIIEYENQHIIKIKNDNIYKLQMERSFLSLYKIKLFNYIKNMIKQKMDKIVIEANKIIEYFIPYEIIFDLPPSTFFEVSIQIKHKKGIHPTSKFCGLEKNLIDMALKYGFYLYSECAKPNFLILDEPFLSFDIDNMVIVNNFLELMEDKYKFTVIISHLQNLKYNGNEYHITGEYKNKNIQIGEKILLDNILKEKENNFSESTKKTTSNSSDSPKKPILRKAKTNLLIDMDDNIDIINKFNDDLKKYM